MNTYPLLKAVTPLDDYRLMLVFGENDIQSRIGIYSVRRCAAWK
jgi:hypothetical protein